MRRRQAIMVMAAIINKIPWRTRYFLEKHRKDLIIMGFVEAVQICLSKYTDFSGRASRSEYWYYVLGTFILGIILMTLSGIMSLFYYVCIIAMILLISPSLAAATRRMHDIGKSGWFLLICLIPIVGFAVFYFLAQPSQPEANEYGPPPTGAA
jgi:uncharacterized membrane protein YhaH (DUF805 family)